MTSFRLRLARKVAGPDNVVLTFNDWAKVRATALKPAPAPAPAVDEESVSRPQTRNDLVAACTNKVFDALYPIADTSAGFKTEDLAYRVSCDVDVVLDALEQLKVKCPKAVIRNHPVRGWQMHITHGTGIDPDVLQIATDKRPAYTPTVRIWDKA